MVYKCIIHGVPRIEPLPKPPPAFSLPPPLCEKLGGISSTGLRECLTTERNFCAVSSGSVTSYEPKGMLFCNSKLLPLRRWEEGSDRCSSDCREFSARSEAITQSWIEIHVKKKHSLHIDQAKRKITVPLCCHPDKLLLHFREFLTEDQQGTNCVALASQRCSQKELQPHLLRALVDDALNSIGKAVETNAINRACA